MTGIIKSMVFGKGYGFIKANDGIEYFFHRDDYVGEWNDLEHFDKNSRILVEFGISDAKTRGPRAENVVPL